MTIDLDPELFQSQTKGDLTLWLPSHDNVAASKGWTRDNLWYRSRVETPSGRTISQGFGKFFNLGQKFESGLGFSIDEIVQHIRDGNEVIATLKHDGSLLIRSVYNGQVFLRTRGSFQYTFHDLAESEVEEFKSRYPKLADPTWHPDKSLLFEWVSPNAQVVIKYPSPEIHLIGGVSHGHGHVTHLSYLKMHELADIAREANFNLVDYFTISSISDWYNFYHEVLNHKEIEGYVLRLNDQKDLVKIKSTLYLAKHSLKFELSYKKMVDMWLAHGPDQSETIVQQLEALYDEEVVMWALPFIIGLEEAVANWRDNYNSVKSETRSKLNWSRKDFAIYMQEKYKDQLLNFSLAMTLYQGAEPNTSLIKKYLLQFDKEVNEA